MAEEPAENDVGQAPLSCRTCYWVPRARRLPPGTGDPGRPSGNRRPVLRDHHAAQRAAADGREQRHPRRADGRGAIRHRQRALPACHAHRADGPYPGHYGRGTLGRVLDAGRRARHPVHAIATADCRRPAHRGTKPVRPAPRRVGARRNPARGKPRPRTPQEPSPSPYARPPAPP